MASVTTLSIDYIDKTTQRQFHFPVSVFKKPTDQNEWIILAHPLFLEQIDFIAQEVEPLKNKDLLNYRSMASTKKLAAIFHLAFKQIPNDPAIPQYRQGTTLGDNNKHWFRAKFFQQYRLFFRFHLQKKIIIYAWVHDNNTQRAYDSKTDAYAVFKKMLMNGNPPHSWGDLLKESINPPLIKRLRKWAH
jgi:toxin YhaV